MQSHEITINVTNAYLLLQESATNTGLPRTIVLECQLEDQQGLAGAPAGGISMLHPWVVYVSAAGEKDAFRSDPGSIGSAYAAATADGRVFRAPSSIAAARFQSLLDTLTHGGRVIGGSLTIKGLCHGPDGLSWPAIPNLQLPIESLHLSVAFCSAPLRDPSAQVDL